MLLLVTEEACWPVVKRDETDERQVKAGVFVGDGVDREAAAIVSLTASLA